MILWVRSGLDCCVVCRTTDGDPGGVVHRYSPFDLYWPADYSINASLTKRLLPKATWGTRAARTGEDFLNSKVLML